MRMKMLVEAINLALDMGEVPYIMGEPGLGKSASAFQVARQRGKPIPSWGVIRPVFDDPTDGKGLPSPVGDRVMWLTPELVYEMKRSKPATILVDELPQGAPAVQAAYAPLFLPEPDGSRKIGQHVIPPGWDVIATGNRKSDRSACHEIPAYLRDRMVFLPLEYHHEDLLMYAQAQEWDTRTVAFLRFTPDLGQKFDPGQDKSPTCRGWDKVQKAETFERGVDTLGKIVTGIVGEGAAATYMGYRRVFDKLPNIDKILKTGQGGVPTEANIQYALVTVLGRKVDERNAKNVYAYMEALPAEFQHLLHKDGITRLPDLVGIKAVQEWIGKHESQS